MPDQAMGSRPPRVAFMALPGLSHFLPDLVAGLRLAGILEVRTFQFTGPDDLRAALDWTDRPDLDALWFEFCWPPFPEVIARTDFKGRRVLVRVHRIEAYEMPHVASTPWAKVDDLIVVSSDMAKVVIEAAPLLEGTTRLHIVHNGVDLARFALAPPAPDRHRIGWCGSLLARKNPTLALEVLARLRAEDERWRLHIVSNGGERLAQDALLHLVPRMGLAGAVRFDGALPAAAMPEWHARNAVLLSTSLHESFGYAIAEAAAVGCDIAVLDHRGAEEFWPETVRFATAGQAADLIRNARPHRWRDLVSERFGLERQVAAVHALLRDRGDPPRRTERFMPIAHGAWRGQFPLRNPADHIQRAVLGTGRFYEAEMLEDISTRLAPGGLFIDVGANIGNHSLFAAAVCGARVLAFEPEPELADHCGAALAANGVDTLLDLRRMGAGAERGRARLRHGPFHNAGRTSLEVTAAGEVPIVPLDDVVDGPAQVLKVDVEGMEAAVLRGAIRILARHRPAVYVETLTDEALAEVIGILAPLGYEPRAQFNRDPTWLFLPAEEAGHASGAERPLEPAPA